MYPRFPETASDKSIFCGIPLAAVEVAQAESDFAERHSAE
jgi:hypothetical protein